jgi:ribulose-5-phosphate 4-epimerase/fuculose-1-phosphate aldolase
MFDNNLTLPSFQTFYLSKEESNCPLISEVVRIGKRIKDSEMIENVDKTIMSLRYGKRLLINANNTSFGEIKQKDFLEIVDYDPVKKVLLTMGFKEPYIDSSVHWLIHHARNEVNAIIQLYDINTEKLVKTIPITEKDYPIGSLEQAKEILKCLRNSKIVIIKNQGIMFVGSNVKEVEDLLIKTLEELK